MNTAWMNTGSVEKPTSSRWMPRWLLIAVVLTGSLTAGVGSAQDTADNPEASTVETAAEGSASEEKPLDNRLKWSTASEVDNFGYHIYRSDSEDGPFERLTEDPMPGAGTTDEPSYYEFIDDSIDPTQDYYYYVESLAMDGTRERFTPVIRAKAKTPVAEDGEMAEDAEASASESAAESQGSKASTEESQASESEAEPPSDEG